MPCINMGYYSYYSNQMPSKPVHPPLRFPEGSNVQFPDPYNSSVQYSSQDYFSDINSGHTNIKYESVDNFSGIAKGAKNVSYDPKSYFKDINNGHTNIKYAPVDNFSGITEAGANIGYVPQNYFQETGSQNIQYVPVDRFSNLVTSDNIAYLPNNPFAIINDGFQTPASTQTQVNGVGFP